MLPQEEKKIEKVRQNACLYSFIEAVLCYARARQSQNEQARAAPRAQQNQCRTCCHAFCAIRDI